jgi:hypothetical protein
MNEGFISVTPLHQPAGTRSVAINEIFIDALIEGIFIIGPTQISNVLAGCVQVVVVQ